jgi:hypothetical protein
LNIAPKRFNPGGEVCDFRLGLRLLMRSPKSDPHWPWRGDRPACITVPIDLVEELRRSGLLYWDRCGSFANLQTQCAQSRHGSLLVPDSTVSQDHNLLGAVLPVVQQTLQERQSKQAQVERLQEHASCWE